MPELPEVETVCRGLKKTLLNQQIISATKFRDNIRNLIPHNMCDLISNAIINDIYRLAKYIIIDLNNNYNLIFHLGMSGRIIVDSSNNYQPKKHDHFLIELSNNSILIFNDPRRFGIIDICQDNELKSNKYFVKMGVEPLTNEFNIKYLMDKFKNKNIPIKKALMDNNIVVGIGNIYASEALFLAKINPLKLCKDIRIEDVGNLINSIKIVLNKALELGGSTLKDYKQVDGGSGYFQNQFEVYGKENESCSYCNNNIVKITMSGRSTFYCSNCQK